MCGSPCLPPILGTGLSSENHTSFSLTGILRHHPRKWNYSERRKQPGRPRVMAEISKLVVGMAKSNPRWGYTRIRGALSNLGHTVARSTIANILREHGIEPAPERSERTPWRTFLAAHWETVAATDFFTVRGRHGSQARDLLCARRHRAVFARPIIAARYTPVKAKAPYPSGTELTRPHSRIGR